MVVAVEEVLELHRNGFWNGEAGYNKMTVAWEISSSYLKRFLWAVAFFRIISKKFGKEHLLCMIRVSHQSIEQGRDGTISVQHAYLTLSFTELPSD